MQDLTDAYSTGYHEARERFQCQARAADWSLERHTLPSTDAEGAALSIDWAAMGADHPEQTLILSSGLHGIDHHAPRASAVCRRAKDRLLNAFCPRDPRWRRRALESGLALIRRACDACSS